jgi:hypothetical protein
MGFFDRLFGRGEQPRDEGTSQQYGQYGGQYGQNQYGEPTRYMGQGPGQQQMTDQQAVDRYRYLLKTAPPDAIEQAHAEAFARLTPDQRRMVLEQLSAQVPPSERVNSEDPRSLARMATRAEMREPGTMERTFGSIGPAGGGIGLGGLMAGTFFSSMAGMFVGSMIANSFFGYGAPAGFDQGYAEGYSDGQTADAGQDAGGDYAGGDYGAEGGGYEPAGDYGGGDFGGGDFGGGDFGGGDFGGGFGDF